MSNCMIYEKLNDVKSMKIERTDDGLMHLSGVFGVCGVKNNNQRIYNAQNYKAMIEKLQSRISEEGCPGELEHPSSMNITLENISHKIDSISIDDKGVVSGTITLLNTPKGKIAQEIVNGGLPLFISSRAQGNVDSNGFVTLEELKTYDLVGTPGFSQARLHLNENQICESVSDNLFYITEKHANEENKKTNEDNMNENVQDLLERIEDLSNEVIELKRELRKKADSSVMTESVQKWVTEEFAPEFEKNLSKNDNVLEEFKQWILNDYTETIQKWVTEEYSEQVQNWITGEFADGVQSWITEEVAPNIEKWVVEEYSDSVEGWMKEEYSEGLQKWVLEEFAPQIQSWIVEEYSPNVEKWLSENYKPAKKASLESIDEALAMLEKHKAPKQVYGHKTQKTNENADEPKYIREMPEDARVKWNLASENVKESIRRKAKLCNFVNEDAIRMFWEGVSFENAPEITNIYEGLENISDDRERAIRMKLRSWANR